MPRYRTSPLPIEGYPPGIPYIIGNELAERFSFYGMKAILVVVMTKHLLDQHGNLAPMGEEQARSAAHLFTAVAYFLPLFGALLSDWLLGKYRTIVFLSLFYCLGHAALAVDTTRFWMVTGLALIALGAGGIKPCVSAHVGDQFGHRNQDLLTKIFGWFYLSINLGAAVSSLLTPWLLVKYGPHVAFGVPGVLMGVATLVFWLGRNKFVHVPPGGTGFVREVFTGDGLRAMLNLAPLFLFVAVFWSLFDQKDSAWVLQAESMDRRFGIEWLSAQLQAINPILILVFVPLFAKVIYPAFDRFFPLTPLRRIALGFFVIVPGFAIPAWLESQITGGRIVRYKEGVTSGMTAMEIAAIPFQSTSMTDPEHWSARNLLDGRIDDGSGWVSAKRPSKEKIEEAKQRGEPEPALFPQAIAIELRERRAWKIDSVRFHPRVDMAKFLKSAGDESIDANTAESCAPKDVEILVGDTPAGPWRSVARAALKANLTPQSVQFEPTPAKYVLIRIESNHDQNGAAPGGDYVCLGELEVLTVEPYVPSAPHSAPKSGPPAAPVPNVAAIGYRPPIIWQVLAIAILTAAEVLVSITCLEFAYTQAPKKMKSFVMSFYLLSVALGNYIPSYVNDWIQNPDGTSKLPGANYYWSFTAAMAVTAVLFVVFAQFYRGRTYIQETDPSEGEGEQPPE